LPEGGRGVPAEGGVPEEERKGTCILFLEGGGVFKQSETYIMESSHFVEPMEGLKGIGGESVPRAEGGRIVVRGGETPISHSRSDAAAQGVESFQPRGALENTHQRGGEEKFHSLWGVYSGIRLGGERGKVALPRGVLKEREEGSLIIS